jgi:hypothetical protein
MPDLMWQDFHLFRVMKSPLKGQCFSSLDEVKDATTAALKSIPENDCLHCFQELYSQRKKCVVAQVQYFEGSVV